MVYKFVIVIINKKKCNCYYLFLIVFVMWSQYVMTSEQRILQHAMEQLTKIPLKEQRGPQERSHLNSLHSKVEPGGSRDMSFLQSFLSPIQRWADKQLGDYHLHFAEVWYITGSKICGCFLCHQAGFSLCYIIVVIRNIYSICGCHQFTACMFPLCYCFCSYINDLHFVVLLWLLLLLHLPNCLLMSSVYYFVPMFISIFFVGGATRHDSVHLLC